MSDAADATAPADVVHLLSGGDRRSIGRVAEAVALVLAEPTRLPEFVAAMADPGPLVRMWAADAVEKIGRVHPESLAPHARFLIDTIAPIAQQEVR